MSSFQMRRLTLSLTPDKLVLRVQNYLAGLVFSREGMPDLPMVRKKGLEPLSLSAADFKSAMFTISSLTHFGSVTLPHF